MKNKQYVEPLTICNQQDLICDNEFVNKEMIQKKCDCERKHICLMILDLLANKKNKEALSILQIDGEKMQ